MLLDIFEDRVWQMSLGERAAIEGVLARLKPTLAIELGTAEGASLQRIAAHAGEVHSFDVRPPELPVPGNVTLHTGDSHELLRPFLAELAGREANVEFVLVDGDHSAGGVRRDVEDLLDSPALRRSVILIHDTANEVVRLGLDSVHFAAWPKVAHVELDWVPGRLWVEPALRNELWSGLGLVIVDAARSAYKNGQVYEQRYYPSSSLLAQMRELLVARERTPAPGADLQDPLWLRGRVLELARELAEERARRAEAEREMLELRAELDRRERAQADLERELAHWREQHARADAALVNITSSASWKLTRPLRAVARGVRRH